MRRYFRTIIETPELKAGAILEGDKYGMMFHPVTKQLIKYGHEYLEYHFDKYILSNIDKIFEEVTISFIPIDKVDKFNEFIKNL